MSAIARRVTLGLLLLVAAAVYVPWTSHEFIWDDFVQITENPAVRRGVPLAQYFTDRETTSTRPDYNERIYRPLRSIFFRWIWIASEASPPHRAAFFLGLNVVLYLLGGLLVYALCRRFTENDLASLIGAGMWLLLPVHGEDVLYASALGDLASLVFQLAGLYLAFSAIDSERPAWGRALGSIALFVLATLTKEMAITSGPLLVIYVLSERRAAWAPSRRMATLFVVAGHLLVTVVYLLLRVRLLGRVGQEPVQLVETLWAVADAPWLLLQYCKLCLMPFGHAPDYGSVAPVVRITAIYAAVGLPLFAWLNLRGTRGVRYGAWLYVVSLAPVMHFVPLWTLMADRFALVPSVGLAMIFAGLAARAEDRQRPLLVGVAVLLGVMWAGASAVEARRFRSDESLFAYGVEEIPSSGLAQHNLGLTLLRKGEIDRAIEHLTLADKLGRRDPRMYHHLAGALEAKGRLDDAARAIAIAIRLLPDYGKAYAQRAAIERRQGDLDAAERSLDEARRHDVPQRIYDRERAAMYVARGQIEEARALYRAMAQTDEPDPLLWQHAAECAEVLGDNDEARDAAERCLLIDPTRAPCLDLRARHATP